MGEPLTPEQREQDIRDWLSSQYAPESNAADAARFLLDLLDAERARTVVLFPTKAELVSIITVECATERGEVHMTPERIVHLIWPVLTAERSPTPPVLPVDRVGVEPLDVRAEALVRELMPDGWKLRVWEQDPKNGGSPWAASVDRPAPHPRLDEDPAKYTAHYGSETRAAALLGVATTLAARLIESPTEGET